jgi:CTP:phosphocholine cytidylyltransferase-like protein
VTIIHFFRALTVVVEHVVTFWHKIAITDVQQLNIDANSLFNIIIYEIYLWM